MEFASIIILLSMFSVSSADYCLSAYNSPEYCSDGCCGYYYNRYCCDTVYYSVGAIIGIVVGCLVGLSITITIIVCVTHKACKKGHRGTVIMPTSVQSTGVTTVSTNVTAHGYQMYAPQGIQPLPMQQPYPPLSQHAAAYPPNYTQAVGPAYQQNTGAAILFSKT